jgi:hypothetical protein
MEALIVTLLAATSACQGQSPHVACNSFLYEPAYCLDRNLRGEPRPYMPQPGDVIMYTDNSVFWEITHDCALAFEPHGSGIVVRRPDGTLGILEAGPNDCFWVKILDTVPHLMEYESRGPVWLRKRKCPLTPEQNAALTDWAMRQEGKRFAIGRLALQVTPFRTRGPLRTFVMGKPKGEHGSYFCSELVTETCVAVGLIDSRTARPSATYPHDLFYDQSYNLYINAHLPLACGWEPPARWVSSVPPINP